MARKRIVFPGVHGEPIEMEPGVYQQDQMPFERYLRINAISNSSLSAAVLSVSPFRLSMAHYYGQAPIEETPSMRFGTMVHAGKFEFRRALDLYDVMPDFTRYKQLPDGTLTEAPCLNADGKTVSKTPKNTNDYAKRVEEYQAGKEVGKKFVTQEEFDRWAGVVRSLDQNERAREYFAQNGPASDRELTIVWDDPVTGLRCKGRIDCVQHGQRLTVDLKTCQNVGRFERSIVDFGYHRQGAWYSDGLRVVTGFSYTPAIVAVEQMGPVHGVAAAPIGFASLSAGRSQYRQILDAIAECVQSGKWPQITSPDEWQIPAWALPHTVQTAADGSLTQW